MISAIYPQKADGTESTGTEPPPLPPPVVLAGPKTTVTPRTSTAPRGKIFEDEVRGTVFWEIAESSDEDDLGDTEGEPVKSGERWGNPFRVEWIKWYGLLLTLLTPTGTFQFPFSGLDCFGILGMETKKSKYRAMERNSSLQSELDF